MTKAQYIKRIEMAAKIQRDNVVRAIDRASEMNDYNSAAIAEAVLVVGSGVMDALNNIALIMCEMLPKEE